MSWKFSKILKEVIFKKRRLQGWSSKSITLNCKQNNSDVSLKILVGNLLWRMIVLSNKTLQQSQGYLGPCQTHMMELFPENS